jgi:hypothetical protein
MRQYEISSNRNQRLKEAAALLYSSIEPDAVLEKHVFEINDDLITIYTIVNETNIVKQLDRHLVEFNPDLRTERNVPS